ncbi:etoposide-induced protein 2.4 homolog isoform X2 [Hydra vulgaris]|uniref:Etoposide-induced protein 2.4 homolog isoform X2 n=1 Tax=Hydra vulgaris TaxID=6087 RepID=A0ABM4B3S1_HYDVU
MNIASVFSFLHGIRDSFLGVGVVINIDNEQASSRKHNTNDTKKRKKVLPMIAQCCFLNGGLLLLSMVLFEYFVVPAVKYLLTFVTSILLKNQVQQSTIWSWLEPSMTYTFKYLWVVPLFWLCKILNCFWFLEIADVAYRKKLGRPVTSLIATKESVFKVISKMLADFLFSIQVEILFLIQAQLVGLIPVVGPALSFIHMALLYSLYAFEYTWANLGWNVVRRLAYIENNWPYFVGFGALLTTLTNISSSTVISACVFGIIFPVFILSGLEAQPILDGKYPLRLFSFVIWLTNRTFLFKSRIVT